MFLVYLLILSVRGNNSSANKTTDNEINEPFENENLLRIALEKHIQNYLEQISRSNEDETEEPTESSLLLTTELAVRLSTTVSTSIQAASKNHESINMRELLGEDAIGNFDQIIIDHDNDGSIIVTKKRKLFASAKLDEELGEILQADKKIDSETKQRTPLLLKVAPDQAESIPDDETQNKKNVKKTDDSSQFIQNEQLITICLAALGVTSTGLLMWIAIQHLYGIYTDFKKTINPIQYYDNGNDDYECDDSVVSARMADRPPTYNASQRQNYELNQISMASPRLPTYTEDLQRQSSYLSQPVASPAQMDEASYYSDSEHSEIAASDIQIPMRNAFTSRRRLERFVGRRRTNSESNNTVDIYRPDHLALPPSTSDQTDSVSVDLPNHSQENEDEEEFDSAPELADMELIHRILKRSKQRTLPKRTTSFTSYNINRQVSDDGSVFVNVQIAIADRQRDGPEIVEISDSASYIEGYL